MIKIQIETNTDVMEASVASWAVSITDTVTGDNLWWDVTGGTGAIAKVARLTAAIEAGHTIEEIGNRM
jgi:hypothetical protein